MSKSNEDYKKEFIDQVMSWYEKIDFIKNQINNLQKLKDFPIINISAFLLKSQLIEFELKQLIFTLDLHLNETNVSKIIKRKMVTPKDLDDRKITLGGLASEIQKYNGDLLLPLHNDLKILVKYRNDLQHKLFDNSRSLADVIKDADKALPLADKVLKEIDQIDFKITGMRKRA